MKLMYAECIPMLLFETKLIKCILVRLISWEIVVYETTDSLTQSDNQRWLWRV